MATPGPIVNVLFVCEDNCALSLMAESILRTVGNGRFDAFSAGCTPGAAANPYVIEFLAQHRMRVAGLRPKGLARFRGPQASRMDFIVTLCDVAANESFSDWPGDPVLAHWSVQDDDAGSGLEAVQRDNFWTLLRRINIFTSLPHGKLSRRVLEQRMLTLQPNYL
jgi:protein-tyrosine-phosphatase